MTARGSARSLWEMATTRWTRRQALVAAGFFAVLGAVGLWLWMPLAVGGFMGAGATALGVALGNTAD